MPLAKKWSEKLYPELEQAGGLRQALQPLLSKLSGELVVKGLPEPFSVHASLTRGARSSSVAIAVEHRAFHAGFWTQGVQYGSGWATSLEDVAAAIHGFLLEQLDPAGLMSHHPWVRVPQQAFAHEQGPTPFVEDAWQSHLDWFAKEPPESELGRLLPLLRACRSRPRLRRLLPCTSHERLGFSRTTGYPYTNECPAVFPLGDGRFRMDGAAAGVSPVDGDAASIAEALDAALPADCPAAVHGTANELGGDDRG